MRSIKLLKNIYIFMITFLVIVLQSEHIIWDVGSIKEHKWCRILGSPWNLNVIDNLSDSLQSSSYRKFTRYFQKKFEQPKIIHNLFVSVNARVTFLAPHDTHTHKIRLYCNNSAGWQKQKNLVPEVDGCSCISSFGSL